MEPVVKQVFQDQYYLNYSRQGLKDMAELGRLFDENGEEMTPDQVDALFDVLAKQATSGLSLKP